MADDFNKMMSACADALEELAPQCGGGLLPLAKFLRDETRGTRTHLTDAEFVDTISDPETKERFNRLLTENKELYQEPGRFDYEERLPADAEADEGDLPQ